MLGSVRCSFENLISWYPKRFHKKAIEEIDAEIIVNCSASGTAIINWLRSEQQKTGCPIIYTSVNSVFQIGGREKTFGLDRLYKICKVFYVGEMLWEESSRDLL
jgi:phosphopentomutase